ncbi:MAG: hypothetical protein Q9160_001230 [Pyrenula sp. 1 TL-2023]
MDSHTGVYAGDGERRISEPHCGNNGQLVTRSGDAHGEVTGSRVRSHDTNDDLSTGKDQSRHDELENLASTPEAISKTDNRDGAAAQTATQNLVAALEKHRSPLGYITDSGRTSEARSMPPQNGQSHLYRSHGIHEQATPLDANTPLSMPDGRNTAFFAGGGAEDQSGLAAAIETASHTNGYDENGLASLHAAQVQQIAGVVADNECAKSIEEEEIPQAIIDAQSYGRVPAYAKLVFPDGLYYMTTLYLVLGRDVLALKAAQENYNDRSKRNSRGTENDRSRPANSLVSLEGGINGFDHDHNSEDRGNAVKNSQTSSSSGHGTVAPQQLQKKKPFDYDKRIKLNEEAFPARKREAPKTVDTQSLLPNHNERPLLPIHPRADLDGAEEIAGHKSISRRHLQIGWNDETLRFETLCIGTNGYYFNGQFRPQGSVDPLESNAVIEIGGIDILWELPQELIPEIEPNSDVESVSPDNVFSEGEVDSANEAIESIETPDQPTTAKRKPKPSAKKEAIPQASSTVEPSAQPEQPLKRKRGRPPKGDVPQRVIAERKREEKAAKAREGNGGVTPPPKPPKRPVGRPKQSKDEQAAAPKPEKRKYTKRKREDDENVEPANQADVADGEEGPVDDAKQAKKQLDVLVSNLPELDTYTDEQKERPKLPYKHLIFQEFVKDPTPKNLTGVYAALVVTWPFFRTLPSSGWQSSVRHNLLGEKHLFEGIETEGRGKLWKLKDGAVLEPATKKRLSPPAPSSLSKQRGPPPMTNGFNKGPGSYTPGGPSQNYPPNGLNGVYGMTPGGQYPPPGPINGVPPPNGALGQQRPPISSSPMQAAHQFSAPVPPNPQAQGYPMYPSNGYQQTPPSQNRHTSGPFPFQPPKDTTQQPENPLEPPPKLIKFISDFHIQLLKNTSPTQREEIDRMLNAVRSIVLRGQSVDTTHFQATHFETVLTHVRDVAKKSGWLDGKRWPAPVQTAASVGDGEKKEDSTAKEPDTPVKKDANKEAEKPSDAELKQ